MAEREEFDLFAYIFNREGEADQSTTETKEEQLPLMNPTVNSDEDDASNSRAAVIKQGDRPRRAQAKLQEPKIDQCNNITTAKGKEFDLFAYIFNRDGEEDQPRTEQEEEDSPLVDLTVDSDEDDASNSTAAVIQQDQPQRTSRQPRRTQIGQLPEPATDSEEEQNEDEEQEKQRGLWSIEVL